MGADQVLAAAESVFGSGRDFTGFTGPAAKSVECGRLGQVERAGLAVGAKTSPVVDAERRVGHLLDFRQHDPRADRMHGPGRDQDAVAGPGLEPMQQGLDGPSQEGGGEVVAGDSGAQAGVDQAAGLGVDDHPGFGLAVVVGQNPAELVVGVDLDREDVVGVEELDQERELPLARERVDEGRAEQLGAAVADEFAEARAGEGTVGHPADVVAVIGQLPALGVARPLPQRFVEDGPEPPAAPDQLFENGLEA